MKICVVGAGFVGKAVVHGFKNDVQVIDPTLGTHTSDVKEADVVFICVPTPMGENGDVDISIVSKVLSELEHLGALLVLKSTVPPNYVKIFARKYEKFVYNPEFLTERNALWDFEHPISNVYGGKSEYTSLLASIYEDYSICKPANTYFMTAEEASFVKYLDNSFLATKVLFMNQFFDSVKASGANYEVITEAICNDKRIGNSHMNVPGHDGRRGFGGACYSKDIPAFIRYAEKVGVDFTLLKEAWNANCEYRNSYSESASREIEQHIIFKKI